MTHTHYYPLSVLHSLVDLFPSFTVTFLKLCSFRIINNHLTRISSGYFRPHLIQPLSSNHNTVLLWNNLFSCLLGRTYPLAALAAALQCLLRTSPQQAELLRLPDPFFSPDQELANYGPQGKSGLLPVFIKVYQK